ncbi:MAG: glycosyltransferase [Chloroflexota bacterium]
MTTFSVLICTYNRSDMLEKALKALINRTDEKPDQVVVVNGGDDRTDLVVQNYKSRSGLNVELVKTVNKNLSTSRNIGFAHCTGEIVAITDDDAEVFPTWVAQMKKAHAEHPEAGGVGGAVLGAESDKSLLSRIADVATFSSPPQSGYVRTIAGVNASYKREVLQAVGPQDETLFRGEDVDYNWRIKMLGYEIYYDPAIKVLHYHRPNLKQFIYQFYMYGRAYYSVRRKWPEMYCVYPHGIHTSKDILRTVNILLRLFYLPIMHASKLPRQIDRFSSLPIFFLAGLYWNLGVIHECWSSYGN